MHDRKLALSLSVRQLLAQGVLTRELASMPESGTGYQLINFHLRDGSMIGPVEVFGCQVIELPDEHKDFLESDVTQIELLNLCGNITHRRMLPSSS